MKTSILALAALLSILNFENQDRTVEVDKIFQWVRPGMPGCVAAASLDGRQVVNRAYGLADLERDVALTTESVFDAGSIRKQFVAAAVLMLVDEGKLSLADDVRKYIAELPDYGHTISIDHLLTHTSGIRDWVPLMNLTGVKLDAMRLILRQRTLNFTPGTEYGYSNSGYVLLPEVVAHASGMKFSEFVQKRLLEPLGMKNSTYVDDPRVIVRNRALAYEKQGNTWRMDALLGDDRGGAGALFTTASDLVIWTDALAHGRLGRFVTDKMKEPATLKNGRKLTYGRGALLQKNYGGTLVWHGGSAGAYKSVVGRFVDQGISIAVLCNAGELADNRTEFAGRIFDLLMSGKGLTRPAPSPVPANAGGVDPADVNIKAGLFFDEATGLPLRLNSSNGRLSVQNGGPLVAIDKNRFRNVRPSPDFMSEAEVELHFLSQDRFELKTGEGETMLFRRAKPWTPSAEDLKAFAGHYRSDELLAFFDVAAGSDSLTLRLNDMQSLQFRGVDPDRFQFGPLTVRFQRDASGNVVALDFTNPVLRNIRFVRQTQPIPRA